MVNPKDCYLKIGRNIGRDSCVIETFLGDSNNLLVNESDTLSIANLGENRNV
jgi:hypothetical protein